MLGYGRPFRAFVLVVLKVSINRTLQSATISDLPHDSITIGYFEHEIYLRLNSAPGGSSLQLFEYPKQHGRRRSIQVVFDLS